MKRTLLILSLIASLTGSAQHQIAEIIQSVVRSSIPVMSGKSWSVHVVGKDTVIKGDNSVAARQLLGEVILATKQLDAAQELLETMDSVEIKSPYQLNRFYIARKKYFDLRGWKAID